MTSEDICPGEKLAWLLKQAAFQQRPFHLPTCDPSTSGHKLIQKLQQRVKFSKGKSVIWHSVFFPPWDEEAHLYLLVAFSSGSQPLFMQQKMYQVVSFLLISMSKTSSKRWRHLAVLDLIKYMFQLEVNIFINLVLLFIGVI